MKYWFALSLMLMGGSSPVYGESSSYGYFQNDVGYIHEDDIVIGDQGRHIFTAQGFISTTALLFKTQSPFVPHWENYDHSRVSYNRSVCAAENDDLFANIAHIFPPGSTSALDRRTELEIYDSNSSQPLLVHVFDDTYDVSEGRNFCQFIDGTLYAAMMRADKFYLKKFERVGSGNAVAMTASWDIDAFGFPNPKAIRITDDQKLITFGTNLGFEVHDISTSNPTLIVNELVIGGTSDHIDGFGFTPSGNVVFVPRDVEQGIGVYRKEGSSYVDAQLLLPSVLNQSGASGDYGTFKIAISEVGSRVTAAVIHQNIDYRNVAIVVYESIAGSSFTEIFSERFSSSLSISAKDIDISNDGNVIAVGFAALSDSVPGVALMKRSSGGLFEVFEELPFQLSDSVHGLDLSAAGDRLAVNRKMGINGGVLGGTMFHEGIQIDLDGGNNETDPPPAPGNLVATNGVYEDRIMVSWTGAGDTYRVFRAPGQLGSNICTAANLVDSNHSTTTFLDLGLPAGSTYTYAVQAVVGNLTSACSAPVTGSTSEVNEPNPPPAPSNLVATDGDYEDRIALSWNGAGDYYRIFRVPGQSSSSICTTANLIDSNHPNTSFLDLGITPGTTHTYAVQAVVVDPAFGALTSVCSAPEVGSTSEAIDESDFELIRLFATQNSSVITVAVGKIAITEGEHPGQPIYYRFHLGSGDCSANFVISGVSTRATVPAFYIDWYGPTVEVSAEAVRLDENNSVIEQSNCVGPKTGISVPQ